MIAESLDDRWLAYLSTQVRIEHPTAGPIQVRPLPPTQTVGEFPDEAGRTIYILTAHNPGRELSDDDNDRKQEQLRIAVGALGDVDVWAAVGGDPDWSHTEDSLAIAGLSKPHALALAQQFGQDAIFAWTPRSWNLMSCDGSRTHAAGWLVNRLTSGIC
ncbi:MAG TPA: DUF3293 domain-containing protein [Actinomycetes bacterium]|nr:DUF3293 domain-containing protein [Actinomycetes bacterium]